MIAAISSTCLRMMQLSHLARSVLVQISSYPPARSATDNMSVVLIRVYQPSEN